MRKAMLPLLREDSLVVSMQNGICTDALAAIVGKERTVGCVIGWGATMHGPGELEMTSGGDFIIGRLVKGEHPRMEALRQALSAVVETRVSQDIYAELYSKLHCQQLHYFPGGHMRAASGRDAEAAPGPGHFSGHHWGGHGRCPCHEAAGATLRGQAGL